MVESLGLEPMLFGSFRDFSESSLPQNWYARGVFALGLALGLVVDFSSLCESWSGGFAVLPIPTPIQAIVKKSCMGLSW